MGFNVKKDLGPTVKIWSKMRLYLETEIIQGGEREQENSHQSGDFIKSLFKTHKLDYILLKNNFQKEVKSQLSYKMNKC